MGNLFSKDAGLTADSIEKYYDTMAKRRAAHAAAEEAGKKVGEASDKDKKKDDQDNVIGEGSGVINSHSQPEDLTATDPDRSSDNDPATEMMRDAGLTPEATSIATAHLNTALRALSSQEKDTFTDAMNSLMRLGVNMNTLAKKLLKWVKARPWEAAAILIPLILLACTPAILGAVGFTAGGIAAGSVAAGIQAGIGSVAAGSAFATLTSAAMGGYGVLIVFGGVWAVPSAVLWAVAAWKRWQGRNNGEQDYAVVPGGGNQGGGGGDADAGKNKRE